MSWDGQLPYIFLPDLAICLPLNSSMTVKKKTELKENEEWRKLFEAVANEPDPQRLSELIDQLIKNLDSRRARAFAAATSNAVGSNAPPAQRKVTAHSS